MAIKTNINYLFSFLPNEAVEKVKSGYKYAFLYKFRLLLLGKNFRYTTKCIHITRIWFFDSHNEKHNWTKKASAFLVPS